MCVSNAAVYFQCPEVPDFSCLNFFDPDAILRFSFLCSDSSESSRWDDRRAALWTDLARTDFALENPAAPVPVCDMATLFAFPIRVIISLGAKSPSARDIATFGLSTCKYFLSMAGHTASGPD